MLFNICIGDPKGLDTPFEIKRDKWNVVWLEKPDTLSRIRITGQVPEMELISRLNSIQRYRLDKMKVSLNRKNLKPILLESTGEEEYIFNVNVPDTLKILSYDTQYRIINCFNDQDRFKYAVVHCKKSEINRDKPIMTIVAYNAQKKKYCRHVIWFTNSDETCHKISIKCEDTFTKSEKKALSTELNNTRNFGRVFRCKFRDGDDFISTIITSNKTDALMEEFSMIPDSQIIEVPCCTLPESMISQIESVLKPQRITAVILDGVTLTKAAAKEIGIRNAFRYNNGKAITQLTLR